MQHFPKIILALAAVFVFSGCESDQEKAERLRLEELYSLDNTEIAKSFKTGVFYNGKSYRDIDAECTKEKQKKITNGKWCAKIKIVNDEIIKIDNARTLPSEPDWGGKKKKEK